ncbi:hypothetical protein Fmac_014466 [Flemingia macrophylla]|uniref:Uncharacterized protein n=1 Tax=Flemingia macrophylla TaxID=520843 RepID=A0ABD1MBS7_9FABA
MESSSFNVDEFSQTQLRIHQKVVDRQNQRDQKAAVMSKLIAKNIDSMKRMLEMESKYNETIDITTELQQLKVTNYNLIEETERIKKEHEKISKELKKNMGLTLSDLQQKNFTEAIQKVGSDFTV